MKKLNLKLFAVAIFLATFFAILPPTPVLAAGVPVQTISAKKGTVKAYLEQRGVYSPEVNPNLLITPSIAAEIDKALREIEELEPMGVSEITTNAPAGLDLSKTELGKPIMVNPAGHQINGIGPKVTLLLACFYLVCVIVILGVAYYIIRKICVGLGNLFSNQNWQLTNNAASYITPVIASSGSPSTGLTLSTLTSEPTGTEFISSLITNSFPFSYSTPDINVNPNTVGNYSNVLAYSFNIQEKSSLMSPWTTNYQFSFAIGGTGPLGSCYITGFRLGNVDLGVSAQFNAPDGFPVYVIRIDETMKPMNFYKSEMGTPTIPEY